MSVAGIRRNSCDTHPGPAKRAETYTTVEVQDMTRRLYVLIEKHYSKRDELQKMRQEQCVLEHKIAALEQDVQRSQESIDELQRKIAEILKVNI